MATPAAILNILVTANTGQATAQLGRLQGQLQATQATAKRSSAQTAASIGRGAARAATAVGAIGVGSIVAAAKFEDAFADVRKTVDATEPQFARLEKGIREMAKQIPVSAQELAHLAGEAGALGVKTEDLLGFTRVAADLGVATDLSASAAANALARLANIMDTKGEKAFSRLGATLVDLGNKGASTESEISEMALRIAGAGQTIGLTESQVLGFSAALANVGVRAEAGGSSISRVMLTMQDAVAQGGKELQAFADISGLTVTEFARKFKTDAPAAIAEFTTGLDKIKDSGGSVVQTLERVGLNEIRVRDALLRLGGATGEVTKAQNIANKAWGENSALAEEANKRYKTTSSQFEILKNRVFDLGITFGQDLLPKVNEAMKALGEGRFDDAIENFADLGADMAKKAIGAFVKAWWDSGILTKLFLTAGFIRLVGGRGALGKVGMALAGPILTQMGIGLKKGGGVIRTALRSVFTKVTFWAQYGAMAAAEWVSGYAGKLGGKLDKTGRASGIRFGKTFGIGIGIGLALGIPLIVNEIDQKFGDKIEKGFDRANRAVDKFGDKFGPLRDLIKTPVKGVINWVRDMWHVIRGVGRLVDDLIHGRWKQAWGDLKQIVRDAVQLVRHQAERMLGPFRTAFNWLKDRWESLDLKAPFRGLAGFVKGVFGPIRRVIRGAVRFVEDLISSIRDAINKVGDLRDKLPSPGVDIKKGPLGIPLPVPHLHEGGLVTAQGIAPLGFQHGGVVGPRGPKPGLRDTVPAMLEVGELVVPKKIVEGTKKNAKLIAGILIGELGKGHKEVGKETEKFTKNHGKAWEKVRDVAKKATQSFRKDTSDDFKKTHKNAVDATGKLKKGAGRDFEATAKDASRRTQQMKDRVSDDFAKTRAKSLDSTQKMRKGVGSGYAGMATAAGEGMRRLAKMTNNALKALGVKKVDFHVAAEGKQRGGAIGGVGVGDKVPALLEPGEFVVNKKATKAARPALEKLNSAVPRFQTGGMAGPASSMARKFVDQFGGSIASGLRPGDDGFHGSGQAFDWVGGNWAAAAKYANRIGSKLLEGIYTGALGGPSVSWDSGKQVPSSFWGGSTWAGHADHIHIAIGQMIKGAVAKQLKRLRLEGPKGPLRDMGQASLDKVRDAANRYLDKKSAVDVESGVTKGMMSKTQIASVWRRANRGEGNPNLMAAIALAESAGNPRAVGHDPGGTQGLGLWQITTGFNDDLIAKYGGRRGMFNAVNNAQAAGDILARQGLGAWVVYGSGAYRQHLKQGGVVDRTGVKHQAIAAPYVGSFDKGGEVAKTGLGLLHKGEHVVAMKKGGFVAGGGGAGGGGPDAQGGGRRGVKAFGVERVRQMREKVGKIVGKAIPYLEESIGIAESLAGLTTSPGGSELSKGEVREQMKLQQKLLATMRKTLNISKRAMGIIDRTIKRIEDSVKNLGRKIAREDKKAKPDKKRIAGWQRDIARRTEAIAGLAGFRPAFTETITEMSGLTGRGGRIFDTTLAIKELRAQGKPQAIGIEDLLAFAEAMRFGAFNRQLGTAGNLPTFATGGIHRGGLALVGEKGPEVVQMPPAQVFPTGTAPAMAPPVVEITFADGMGWLKDFVQVEIKNREQRERGRWRRDVVAR